MNPAANKPRVAFLGLGLMGAGMAGQLLKAGFPLSVFNRRREKAEALVTAGARIAATPAEAAGDAGVIISMVADDNASRAVWLGDDGALAKATAGAVCIESSTVTVRWVNELAATAAQRGCEFLDAPVTGSKVHAASGELSFLVGGPAATLEKVRPVLAAMGKSIVPLGPVGSGALLKLINNFVCGVQIASLAEAMAMIERSGLDRTRALEILTTGAPGSPIVKTVAGRITAADYAPNFLLRLMAKDLAYAIGEGKKLSVELGTAAAALVDFQVGIAGGFGDQDIAAIIEPLRKARVK
jgi:3-hydroxyisobutyrate dehydrogenase